MSPAEGSQVYQALLGRCHAIVDRLYQAIARTSYVPLSEAQVREQLVTLTAEIIALLFMEPFEQSRAIYEAASPPKELVIITGADHNDPPLVAGPQVVQATVRFIDEHTSS